MKKECWFPTVLGGLLFISLLFPNQSLGQNPPTMLVVVRASDDSLWKMTCDESACTSFSSFPGKFRQQPAVTWDEKAQEWVVIGAASDNTIWTATFDKNGNFNNDWQVVPGLTPSPAGISGSFYTLGSLGCASGQIPKWTGSAWACAADDIGSTVTPSSTVANLDGTSSAGSSATYSRGDHKHGIGAGSIGNAARGYISSVSGGSANIAGGDWSSVSGGDANTASGIQASVSGGSSNIAGGAFSSVGGGGGNTASGDSSAVSGGLNNSALGWYSSVSGGSDRSVTGDDDWRGGQYFSDN